MRSAHDRASGHHSTQHCPVPSSSTRDRMQPVREIGRRLRSLGRPRILPSLYDRYPHAASATRRPLGMQVVSVDRIVGTARNPSQNTDDFRPLPQLRGRNWAGRWQRLNRAMQQLVTLPPVDLLRVGRDYWVVDGHNRVAAALRSGVVGLDADVVELLLPGVDSSMRATALGGRVAVRDGRAAPGGHRPADADARPSARVGLGEPLRPAARRRRADAAHRPTISADSGRSHEPSPPRPVAGRPALRGPRRAAVPHPRRLGRGGGLARQPGEPRCHGTHRPGGRRRRPRAAVPLLRGRCLRRAAPLRARQPRCRHRVARQRARHAPRADARRPAGPRAGCDAGRLLGLAASTTPAGGCR